MINPKWNKIGLLSPIIITGIIAILSISLHWRNIDLGYQLTPAMIPHLGQPASVKLDIDPPQKFMLTGNLDINVLIGEHFEIWISPFLLNYAEIQQKDGVFSIRSMYTESQKALMEAVTIILPQDTREFLNLTVSGNSDLTLKQLTLENLTLDLLGNQNIDLEDSHVNYFTLHTKGMSFIQTARSGIAQLHIHNIGILDGDLSLIKDNNLHTIVNWGTADLRLQGEGVITLKGMGQTSINQQVWQPFSPKHYNLSLS